MLCGYSPPLFPAGALLLAGSTSVSAAARTSACFWLSPSRQTRSAGRITASRKFGRSTTSIVLPEAYLRPSARRSARVVFCAFQLFIPDLSYSRGLLPRNWHEIDQSGSPDRDGDRHIDIASDRIRVRADRMSPLECGHR